MYKTRKRFYALFMAVIMILSSIPVVVHATYANGAEGECTFDQQLEQLREELFSRPAYNSGLAQVYVDLDEMKHLPFDPSFEPEEHDGYVGIAPLAFTPQNYVEGSTRLFRTQIRPNSSIVSYVQGHLARQGQHVNIWVLDPDHYYNTLADLGLMEAQRAAERDLLADIIANTAMLDDMAARFDGVTQRMTEGLAPFAGIVATTWHNVPHSMMPYVGDVHQDGRVNVLLYNVRGPGGGVAGFFSNNDYRITSAGNTPIALVHVNMSRASYNSANNIINDPTAAPMGIYYTFAHELQHLLFHMHFGVYLDQLYAEQFFLWLNEGLSEHAAHLFTLPSAVVVSPGLNSGIWNAAENDYSTGDFINFRGGSKSVAITRLHSLFMHRMTGGTYARDLYDFFRAEFPPAADRDAYIVHRARIQSMGTTGMQEILGDAFNAIGLTGSTGTTGVEAFNLLYFIFMENFAADGGDIIRGNNTHGTTQFYDNPASAFNLWGIRPALGVGSVHQVWPGDFGDVVSSTSRVHRPAIPTLNSGGSVSLAGFGASIPSGATHERVYRLVGENVASPALTISIDDNDPSTRFYVAVPNDAPGVIGQHTQGSMGATLYPLVGGNVANVIDTGGQVAYLFVATLFRDVREVRVSYSWGVEVTPTPAPTMTPTPTPSPAPSVTPSPAPTPTPLPSEIVVDSWGGLAAVINAAPVGVATTIQISRTIMASNPISIPTGRHITLVSTNVEPLAANVRDLTQNFADRRHFIVEADSSLTLCQNIRLTRGASHTVINNGGVVVNGGGELIMNAGSMISGLNQRSSNPVVLNGYGTGEATQARLTMLGGVIERSTGFNAGAVEVGTNSILVMRYDSEIRYNRIISISTPNTLDAGGVRLTSDTSVFEMHDNAAIRNNSMQFHFWQHVGAGGVMIINGTFSMYGGSIVNNSGASGSSTSAGVTIINDGTFILHDGIIGGNSNHGVLSWGSTNTSIIMNGGEISDNASNGVTGPGRITMVMNGGIINNNGRIGVMAYCFTMNDGTISNNGDFGVSSTNFMLNDGIIVGNRTGVTSTAFTMSGGTISNNVNPNGNGGGVVIHFFGNANITGGIITGNSALRGGGVFVMLPNEDVVTITGGSITDNHAMLDGGGIFSGLTTNNMGHVTPNATFSNINIGPDVIFTGNTAGNGSSAPPLNYYTLTHIASRHASIWGHPINNYDINYTGRLGQEHGITSWEELRAAVNAAPANTPTTIYILSSFEAPTVAAGSAITIPSNRQITLVSSNPAPGTTNTRELTQANTHQHHFIVQGSLTLGRTSPYAKAQPQVVYKPPVAPSPWVTVVIS